MLKKLCLTALFSLTISLFAATGKRTILLFGNAISPENYEILLPDAPSPSERRAASELRDFLREMTGHELEVLSEGQPTGRKKILVGECATAPKYGFAVDYPSLGLEAIRIESNPENGALMLAGGRRGCLYAVFDFLETELGCRWFAKDCQVIPNAEETVALGKIQREFHPVLEQRDANYTCCYDVPTSVRNKLNGAAVGADASWGSHVRYYHLVHTFDSLVPVAKYGAEHPEYFSEINGKRVLQNTQLCLTNPEVLRIATAEVMRLLASTEEDVIISVSQNDNMSYCQCENCTALAEKEGSQCGPLLAFVNAIAAETEKHFPGRIIDTLAYQYTRKPPKNIRPLPNVAVRLCSIECCFSHPLEECPFNASFVQDIKAWNRICKRLHIWDYVINYAHNNMPFPNFRVLKPNIQFFIDHGVTSIFEEANYYSDHGEFAELRSYVMFKLLWDPSYDTEKAVREFTDAYFGAAAPYIREYLTMMHDWVCSRDDVHLTIYLSAADYLNDLKKLNEAAALFQKAMAAVQDDAERLLRVQTEYLSVIYAKTNLTSTAMFLEDGKLLCRDLTGKEDIQFFAQIARKVGIARMGEGASNTTDAWIAEQQYISRELSVVTLQKDGASLEVIPALGGRIWRATLAGRQILQVKGDEQHGFGPVADGWEEYSTIGYRSEGFATPFSVTKQSADTLEMSAVLSTGAKAFRRMEILDGASFRVTSWYENPDGTPSQKSFRIHPCFRVPSPLKALLKNASSSTENREYALGDLFPVNREGEMPKESELYFQDGLKPDGRWELVFQDEQGKSWRLVHEFPREQVDFTYVNVNRLQKRVNLEVWTAGGKLENTYHLEKL